MGPMIYIGWSLLKKAQRSYSYAIPIISSQELFQSTSNPTTTFYLSFLHNISSSYYALPSLFKLCGNVLPHIKYKKKITIDLNIWITSSYVMILFLKTHLS